MKLTYYPEVDYLHIRLRSAATGTVGGEDVAPGVVLLTDDAGAAIELEVDSASKRLDLELLEVEGLPISVAYSGQQESQVG